MKWLVIALSVMCGYCFVGIDGAAKDRQDTLQAFQPLKKAGGGKVQRKLIAGESELFVALQSELILSQEQYVQQTIDDESNIRNALEQADDTDCAGFVATATDSLMALGGISFSNCVAMIDEEMFANLYPSTSNTERQEYAKASMLTALRGLNIFTEASTIRTKLEAMLTAPIAIDGVSTTVQLSSILRSALNDCLIAARALLKQSLGGAYTQADTICTQ